MLRFALARRVLKSGMAAWNNREAYDAALAAFQRASQEWRKAQMVYRARIIDDAAFLAARKVMQAAQAACDEAEAAFIKANKETA